ncbi:MAG: hypothetical protein ACOC0N_00270 [Chroococcales cyanobacterium]
MTSEQQKQNQNQEQAVDPMELLTKTEDPTIAEEIVDNPGATPQMVRPRGDKRRGFEKDQESTTDTDFEERVLKE